MDRVPKILCVGETEGERELVLVVSVRRGRNETRHAEDFFY